MTMKLLISLALFCAPLVILAQDKKDEPKQAKDLLADALSRAKEGKKRVLLTFGAPG
jgi:hypothetical protein